MGPPTDEREEAHESTYRDVLPDATETRFELTSAYSDADDASEAAWLTYGWVDARGMTEYSLSLPVGLG